MEIFIEPHVPAPHVMLVGNAPLVTALADMARAIEYDVDVVDVRTCRLPVLAVFVVVATFGRYDEDAVAAALEAGVEYVALVASAKRAATVLEALRAIGVTAEGLARVRAPAGLDLGSLRHLEIGAAVLADVVASKPAEAVSAAPGAGRGCQERGHRSGVRHDGRHRQGDGVGLPRRTPVSTSGSAAAAAGAVSRRRRRISSPSHGSAAVSRRPVILGRQRDGLARATSDSATQHQESTCFARVGWE